MKNFKKLCCMLIATASCTQLFGQEAAKEKKPSAEEQMWMSYMTTGPMHQMLAKSNGMWNEDITMWMTPNAPPTKSTATCINRMIMGGRYQQGMTHGNFNGMPFEGTSTVGYDNAKKVFVSTWIDNMGTGIVYTEGPYNEATKTLEMKGNMVDPMTGKDMGFRETLKFNEDNTQLMEMYNTPAGGKEYKSMEIKFSKKQIDKQPMSPGVKPMPQGQKPPMQQEDKKPVDKK